jgi:hypothetical protein
MSWVCSDHEPLASPSNTTYAAVANNEEDSSNIESEKESLDESDKQEDLEERTQTPDSFEPSEAISEDIAVPFPVDI